MGFTSLRHLDEREGGGTFKLVHKWRGFLQINCPPQSWWQRYARLLIRKEGKNVNEVLGEGGGGR